MQREGTTKHSSRSSELEFQKLDVYRCAITLLALSCNVRELLPRGHGVLDDQLHRASLSIPLNIAEGCGKRTPRDRAKFLSIARGSAMECAAIFDVLLELQLIRTDQREEAIALLNRIVAMLTKMIF